MSNSGSAAPLAWHDMSLFYELIQANGRRVAQDAIVSANAHSRWGELARLSESFGETLRPLAGRRVGLMFSASAAGFGILAALDRLGCSVFLFDGDRQASDAMQTARSLNLGALIAESRTPGGTDFESAVLPDEEVGDGESSVTILTSGSTGAPKAARHSWQGLLRPVRRSGSEAAPRWLLSYRPHLYAGLQVALQCFANAGTLIVPRSTDSPGELVALMRNAAVQFVSATPSYWRRLLMLVPREELSAIEPRQITLGGEVVDEQVLQALRETFPHSRIVHIYATTELGRCFSVTDGHSGFPLKFIASTSADGVELRIDNGELLARSGNAMHGYDRRTPESAQRHDDGWFRTGDLVEVRGERVYFMGRSSEMINVGGNKVSPLEVENVLRAIPGVRNARVYGKRSSLMGQIVACDIVPTPEAERQSLHDLIVSTSLSSLNSVQRPRLIEFVDEIQMAESGKTLRRAQR